MGDTCQSAPQRECLCVIAFSHVTEEAWHQRPVAAAKEEKNATL